MERLKQRITINVCSINCNAGGRRRCGGMDGRDVRGLNCLHYTDDDLIRVTVVVGLYIGYQSCLGEWGWGR
jgi:hypothetical protein